jgi:hypothetical protein
MLDYDELIYWVFKQMFHAYQVNFHKNFCVSSVNYRNIWFSMPILFGHPKLNLLKIQYLSECEILHAKPQQFNKADIYAGILVREDDNETTYTIVLAYGDYFVECYRRKYINLMFIDPDICPARVVIHFEFTLNIIQKELYIDYRFVHEKLRRYGVMTYYSVALLKQLAGVFCAKNFVVKSMSQHIGTRNFYPKQSKISRTNFGDDVNISCPLALILSKYRNLQIRGLDM